MNVSSIKTMNYEQITMNNANKNKANTNPIKPNSRNAQMNVSSLITKDYIKYDDFAVRKNKPNSNPISKAKKCCGVCPEDFGERKQVKTDIDVNEQT